MCKAAFKCSYDEALINVSILEEEHTCMSTLDCKLMNKGSLS